MPTFPDDKNPSSPSGRGPCDPRPGDPRPWEKLGSEQLDHMLVFRPRWDTLRHPRSSEVFKRLVLEIRQWVNIVALTGTGQVICVRQFRFGTETVTTEIPGGVIDPGEESGAAAQRELREETGYTSQRWTYLGYVEPNPAIQDNICHHWLAEDARLTHPQDLDSGEDISVILLSITELLAATHSGEIRHGLVLNALARVFDLRDPASPIPTISQ